MPITDILKVLIPSAVAFFIGIALTPLLTHYLYKYKAWKKTAGKKAMDGKEAPIFNLLHKEKEVGTPKMGGVIIWGSVLLTIGIIWLFSEIFPTESSKKLDFLSRSQTWLPLFTLVSGSLIGIIDDFLEIQENGGKFSRGLSLSKRLFVVFLIGCVGAWWFYSKLEVSQLAMPFDGVLDLGWLFIPFFILVVLAVYASGVIDGLDGLAGGVFASVFFAYSVIAFYQDQINLAAFCAVIVGGILAFLWFNIPPARFYMSETGTMGLTVTLAVVAFLTDVHGGGRGVLILPIIAFPLFATLMSNIIQVGSKKLRGGKKVFLVAPIHHHFEAMGWPAYKVTMRYWIISAVFAIIGVVISLFGV